MTLSFSSTALYLNLSQLLKAANSKGNLSIVLDLSRSAQGCADSKGSLHCLQH